uniref:NADH dehydrogenase subunit 6 n=1 Tax=Stenostomum sthenum TaxID=1611831 RepID=A0A1Z1M000_9PLAT|nr:NADH dehydrogenase subunit 6 [Stenostomum sthenum]ARW59254.1 NADH dehydrogenase subunit 6 [Stenostomum sthenum]
MVMMALNYLILVFSIMILSSFHPIFMGMLMLVLCLFISTLMSLMTYSWLSFLLFYLMSGGILMLLLYMSCFSFNPIFKKSIVSLLIILVSSLIVFNQYVFSFKKYFSNFMCTETGMSLGNTNNMWMFILISLFMFLCFFNISKILTSFSFSMRKFFLSSYTSTANSC